MRRIPQMFYALTAQLRLFIAVMGLDYTYSIPGMCHDDTTCWSASGPGTKPARLAPGTGRSTMPWRT